MNKPKVVAVIEARVLSGPAKNLLRFASGCRDFIDMTIITFVRHSHRNPKSDLTNPLIEAVRNLHLPLEIIQETGRFDPSVLLGLTKVFEKCKPDILQTHGIKSHFLVSLLFKRNYRWIAFHHGYTNEDLKMQLYRHFNRWSFRICDCVVTVCARFADDLAKQGIRRDRIVVVHNSVESDFIHPDNGQSEGTRRRLAIAPDQTVILSVGRLSREKGHRYLIDAISNIVKVAPEVKLRVLIVGTGPAERSLRKLIARHNLQGFISLLGQLPDVKPLFAIADLFVLPSLSEGSPNVLLESMAAKVPVVATSVGGVPEIVVDGESAILVCPANAETLSKSMLELLQDGPRAKHLAEGAFQRVRAMFNPAKHDEQLLAVYAQAMDRHERP